MSVELATDGLVFKAYLEQVLVPVLRPGQVVQTRPSSSDPAK